MRLKSTIYESTLSTADAVPLPRWGAKNVLPLNLIAFPARGLRYEENLPSQTFGHRQIYTAAKPPPQP